MKAPDVPLRLDLAFEVPGTPEQVWHAIATAEGISSWFLPTDLDGREGGSIVFHMGPDDESAGSVTGWDPPRRFACVEPDWAALTGHAGAAVTPLATEFLVEARSGGTCVVRVVTSAFGTGADWEGEFFEEMERGWTPFFDNLRLYLTHFPGQRATPLRVATDVKADAATVRAAMRRDLGVSGEGQRLEFCDLVGTVERVTDLVVLVRLTDPAIGYVMFSAYDTGDESSRAGIDGYLFSTDTPETVQREEQAWTEWLQRLAAEVSSAPTPSR